MEGSYFGEGLTLLGEKWVRKNVGCNLFVLLILQIGDLSFLMTVIQTSFFKSVTLWYNLKSDEANLVISYFLL